MQPEIGKIIYVRVTRNFLINFPNQFLLNVPSYYIPSENTRKPYIGFMMFFRKYKK